jgi:hypothetical protein
LQQFELKSEESIAVQADPSSTTTKMSTSPAPSLRIVPGVPAPPPMSKSQKKKNKSKLNDSPSPAVSHLDLPTNGQSTPVSATTPQLHIQKLSPVMDLIGKRLKAAQKKIVCLSFCDDM